MGATEEGGGGSWGGMRDRGREGAGEPFEIGKDPVAAFVPEPGKGVREIRLVIHGSLSCLGRPTFWDAPKLEAFQGPCRGDNCRASVRNLMRIAVKCCALALWRPIRREAARYKE